MPEKKMRLVTLALPILFELVLRNLMGTVNVFLLSRYSDDAVAAVGVANQIINVVVIAFTMISAGAAVVINQSLGAKEDREAGKVAANALSAAALLGLLVSVIVAVFAETFVRALGLEEALVADAVAYLRITGAVSIFMSLSSMMSNIFRCHGNAKIPMIIVLINNILNLVGTALVIYQPIQLPISGVSGVGFARASSELIGIIIFTILLIRAKFSIHIRDLIHIDLRKLATIARIGLMSGTEGICYTLGQVVTTGFLTSFGAAALSAKVYVQNIDYYAYVVGLSIGQAMQIIVGHKIGAGDNDGAYRFVNHTFRYVAISNLLFGVSLYIFSDFFLGMFTSDPEIISIAKTLLFIDMFIHLGRSLNHSFNYGLRSAGYVFWPMLVGAISIWLANVGLGYVFSTTLSLGAAGLWIAQTCDEWIRGTTFMIFWKRKNWTKTKIKI